MVYSIITQGGGTQKTQGRGAKNNNRSIYYIAAPIVSLIFIAILYFAPSTSNVIAYILVALTALLTIRCGSLSNSVDSLKTALLSLDNRQRRHDVEILEQTLQHERQAMTKERERSKKTINELTSKLNAHERVGNE